MSVSQMYPPANTHALLLNHDYTQETPSDHWLRTSNITEISDENISEIQRITNGQSKNKLWLEELCKRIHSSNFGRICKATDKTDFQKLANKLTQNNGIIAAPLPHG